MRLQSIGCLVLALLCCLLSARFFKSDGSTLQTAPDVSWAAPASLAINNLGPVDRTELEKFSDCTALTYRMIDDPTKTMREGCFIETAFGRIDSDKTIVIFNGSDEAEYIKGDGTLRAISTMPHSGSVATFGGSPEFGTYMYTYSDFYGSLRTQGSPLTGGRFKRVIKTPDLIVRDSSGQPLNVNPLAFNYSARSQWFVTEVPGKALVRVSLASHSVLPFAPNLNIPGRPLSTNAATMAITPNGRYAAIASAELKSLQVYDLKDCGVPEGSDPLRPHTCRSHNYWAFVEQQTGGPIVRIGNLRFTGNGLLSFNVQVGSRYESYLMSPDGPITSLIPYLGLGDSYASGQGAFNYLAGTDTATNKCHLSIHSYPLRLNQTLFSGLGKSVACSGARSHDVISGSEKYSGQTSEQVSARAREADGSEVTILHDFKPGYLAQQRFVTSYQPGVMTAQIGGNDIGFGTMLMRCLSPLTGIRPLKLNPNSCYQSREDRLEIVSSVNRTYPKLVLLYQQLRKQSPSSRLYVVGYPHILSPKALCRTNVPLTLTEIQFAREVVTYINSVVQKAAASAGVRYVDVSDAFDGYELCSGSSNIAVNGLTAGDDSYGLGQESFHPNAFGHELLEKAILSQTNNLRAPTGTIPVSTPPEVSPNEPLLQAPATGRPVTNVTYHVMTSGMVRKGQSTTITIDGQSLGIKPNTAYQVTVGSSAAGTVTSDDNGDIKGTVTTPGNTTGGVQSIAISGPGQGETPITIIDVVYVPITPDDTDGDGITNISDRCPLISGEDCDTLPVERQPENPKTPTIAPGITSQGPEQLVRVALGHTLNPQNINNRIAAMNIRLTTAKPVSAKRLSVTTSSTRGTVLGTKQRSSSKQTTTPMQPLAIFYWWLWAGLLGIAITVAAWTYKSERK